MSLDGVWQVCPDNTHAIGSFPPNWYAAEMSRLCFLRGDSVVCVALGALRINTL